MKTNWIIVWHDRHRDDLYKIVLNATYEEAQSVELEIARSAGWENETMASEDYWINLIELSKEEIIKMEDDE